jgi:HlyD family secretion protein
MAARRRSRLTLSVLALLLVAAGLAFAFWPRPVAVDLGQVKRGPMKLTIDEEGRTRVHDTYVISTPVAGRLLRVEVEPGDLVEQGQTVVARMLPSLPSELDQRSREEAQAAVAAAEAAVRLARSELNKAIADKEFAEIELERVRRLREMNSASQAELEAAVRTTRAATASVESAEAGISVREAELSSARARLLSYNDHHLLNGNAVKPALPDQSVPIRAPDSGRVLRVIQQSETTLAAGTPIMEIGDTAGDLEVVVELLSTDAVKVKPGDPVLIEDWGGVEALQGVVERVEPWGFTKYSALGVEEQRVNAVIRFTDTRLRQQRLGHGYRVEARIVIWEDRNALIVPSSALFREGQGWAVFVVQNGEARIRKVEIGHDNGVEAEVKSGLEPGQTVVLYPSLELSQGKRVVRRLVE